MDRIANALRLTAIDDRAAKAGLAIGMALTDARALFPVLEIQHASPADDERLLDRLADWCDRYTPLVALDPPHGMVLDITGCAHLFGGEESLLKDILARLARNGFAVKVAIAANASAAHVLARFTTGGVFSLAETARRVAALPLAALEIDEAAFAGLKRAGLRCVGDVAAIPRASLTSRFGKVLVDRLDALSGHVSQPISPRRTVPLCMVERRMAEPLSDMESVEQLVRSLGAELVSHLEQRSEGVRAVEAAFFRADGAVRRVLVGAGRPVVDGTILFRLFRERLSSLAEPLDAGYGFDVIRLSATRTERVTARQKSLDSTQQETIQVDALLDRLAVRLGEDRVLRPSAVDTHIPERAVVLMPAMRSDGNAAVAWAVEQLPDDPPARPVRLFNPPEPIEITAVEVPDGPPARFRWRRVLHRVMLAEGPERIAPEWWAEYSGMPIRDYYRVEDDGGRRFWVFREGLMERNDVPVRWFLHGLFA